MRTGLFALFGILSLPLAANVVTTAATSNLIPSGDSNTFCRHSGAGPVSCSITYFFSDATGHQGAGGGSSITADYGIVTGIIQMGFANASVAASFQGSFGDELTVLGGAGNGTLITHYTLTSVDSQRNPPGFGIAPSYRFVQGDTVIDHAPNIPPPILPEVGLLIENLDVSSPIVFGVPLTLAAGTRVLLNPVNANFILNTNARVQLTGFTVLDSSGAVVQDATVQRSFVDVQDVFVPEPGTGWCAIAGIALFLTCFYFERSHSAARAGHAETALEDGRRP